jgi:tetratricopeptide (TPR) repeat protein
MAGTDSSEAAFDATQRTEHTESTTGGPRVDRGAQVGRYLMLDVLGAGGMGVVYSAYDPELDRKVAIKLLLTRGSGSSPEEERTWVLREAQALARLSHPNVISVFDVGTLDDERVFVAMEMVAGVTLRKWAEAAKRTWREVAPILHAAGAGLAAAHAVGLVHRDFKPENVMVGDDGRTRVMDFGLARLRRDGAFDEEAARVSDLKIDVRSPLSQELTIQGQIVGTPAYLAPEIFAGKAADARSDQYAFGVTLYYALYGAVPYDLQTIVEGRAKPPKLPAEPAIPTWLERVILRAIAIAPEDRYESMDALLRELGHTPPPRRRAFVAVGAVAIVAGGVFVASRTSSEPCTGTENRLAGVWDASTKQTVHDAYLATKLPFAERAFAALDHALDRYTHDWVTMSVDSCRATRVRRDQNEDVLALRQACLDRRLTGLRALVRELTNSPSAAVVTKADGAAFELERIEGCGDIDTLSRPGNAPNDPRYLVVTEQLAEVNAQLIAGRYLPALVTSQKVVDVADALGYAPAQAMAHHFRGAALLASANIEDGVREHITATKLALAAGRDDLAAPFALNTATFVAEILKQPAEGRVWLEIGLAEAQRVPRNDGLELSRESAIGVVAAANGDPLTAVAAHRRMLDVAVRMYGHQAHPLLAAELELATSLNHASLNAEAVEHFQAAIALAESIVGPEHPDNATLHANLGMSLGRLGRLDQARAEFARALALLEKNYGPNSPILVVTLNNIADNLNAHGDPTGALEPIERAMKLARPVGTDSAFYHVAATTRGEVLTSLHRYAEARSQLDEVLPIEERVHSTMLPTTLASRAELALAEHAWADAVTYARRSTVAFEAVGGNDNPELWRPLSTLGRAEIELGKRDDARRDLERAVAIASKLQLAEDSLAPARAALATLR